MMLNSWTFTDWSAEKDIEFESDDECQYSIIQHSLDRYFSDHLPSRGDDSVSRYMAFIRDLNAHRFDKVRRQNRLRGLCGTGVPPKIAREIVAEEEALNCAA